MKRLVAILVMILCLASAAPARADDGLSLQTLQAQLQQLQTKVTALETQLKQSAAATVDANRVYELARHSVVGIYAWNDKEAVTGTGVIWWRADDKRSAQAITNQHVVVGMTTIYAILTDGRIMKAEHVTNDADLDLAVIEFQSTNLPPAITLGDSDELRIGSPVIAIGNPLGQHNAVTLGIFSGRKNDPNHTGYEFLQTDAAINPGNSGGPLLDKDGRLVGMITMKWSQSEGVALASSLRSIQMSIAVSNHPDMKRTYLGAILAEDSLLSLGFIPVDREGLKISTLDPLGPLSAAGFKVGDELLQIGTVALNTLADARSAVDTLLPGTSVKITGKRGDAPVSATIVLTGLEQWVDKRVLLYNRAIKEWEAAY